MVAAVGVDSERWNSVKVKVTVKVTVKVIGMPVLDKERDGEGTGHDVLRQGGDRPGGCCHQIRFSAK